MTKDIKIPVGKIKKALSDIVSGQQNTKLSRVLMMGGMVWLLADQLKNYTYPDIEFVVIVIMIYLIVKVETIEGYVRKDD